MEIFNWDIKSHIINISDIVNKVNADKLFVSLIVEIEKSGIDIYKDFSVSQIVDLIPRGTAGVSNYSTYGFSIMSMFSGQKDRDYFIFLNSNLRNEFTSICNNNYDRDNYFWRKHYLNEKVKINTKYLVKENN